MGEKIIVILGPTASGKSTLAVKIALLLNSGQAKKISAVGWNGVEIVSADSRQVYRGLDIGSGKITKKEMMGIPHHLLDIASPKQKFTVAQYQKLANKAIDSIFRRGRIPIICGGTGFYIRSVIDGIEIPEVKPDWRLRKKLEKETPKKLFEKLRKMDPRRAKDIDKNNKRRLIRALEIVIKTKKAVPTLKQKPLPCSILIIGIKKSHQELEKLIKKRLQKRFRQGMIAEIKKLRKNGISWKRLEELGLEYRYVAQYLQGKFNKKTMIEKLQKEIEHFAKRQMTWFKKDKRIKWVRNYKQTEKIIKNFEKKRETFVSPLP